MNILLIGNGFDLAHGLPTRYDDFLDFIKLISEYIINGEISQEECKKLNFDMKLRIRHNLENPDKSIFFNFWKNLIIDNIWFAYFFENRSVIKENWIDFEKEICFIISNLDFYINKKTGNDVFNDFFDFAFKKDSVIRNTFVLKETYFNKINYNDVNLPHFIVTLENDLKKLILALEVYISEFVNIIEINKISREIANLKIDKVLSFNYSNTYDRVYGSRRIEAPCEYDYIHGKAFSNSTIEKSRIVLGINEYLPEKEKNTNLQFIRYKKFFQRIHKKTGCKYTDWLETINNKEGFNNLYIFGHSLDGTDGDILRDLILNNKIQTTIFYYNEEAYAQQITNLVNVIGQEELIKRTGGTQRIKFIKQADFSRLK